MPVSNREKREQCSQCTLDAMGVSLDEYRRRIGTHVPFAGLSQISAVLPYSAESRWDTFTDLNYRHVIATFALAFWFLAGMMMKSAAGSNCAVSLLRAFAGDEALHFEICDSRSVTSTDPMYICDLSGMLILSGDVETNPGPVETKDLERALTAQREAICDILSAKFESLLMREVEKIRDDLGTVMKKVDGLERELKEQQDVQHTQELDIRALADANDDNEARLQTVEERQEELDIRSRRDNVLLYGVSETEEESPSDCAKTFAKTVNDAAPDVGLHESDIVRAHRLGRPGEARPRPIIARLLRTSFTHAILQARPALRERGLGVSSALTKKQREALGKLKAEGKTGFFRGGKLIIRHDSNTQDRHSDRRQTRQSSCQQNL